RTDAVLVVGFRGKRVNAGFLAHGHVVSLLIGHGDRPLRLQAAGVAEAREDLGAIQGAVLPCDRDVEPAAGAQAFDVTGWPRARERGEQTDEALVALQEHLSDAGSAA